MTSKIGHLRTASTNSAGRKVDEWVYESPFRKKHRCVVKILDDSKGIRFTAFPMAEGASAQGSVGGRALEAFKPITDTDINRLKAAVFEAYRIYDDISNGAQWENWLEIRITKYLNTYEGFKAVEVSVGYRVIKKATLTDGREVTINRNNFVEDFPRPKAQGVEDEKPESQWAPSRRNKEDEYAYIPATEENIKTLEAMTAGMVELHSRVSAFVRTSNATGSLDASTFKALPSPADA